MRHAILTLRALLGLSLILYGAGEGFGASQLGSTASEREWHSVLLEVGIGRPVLDLLRMVEILAGAMIILGIWVHYVLIALAPLALYAIVQALCFGMGVTALLAVLGVVILYMLLCYWSWVDRAVRRGGFGGDVD